MQALPLTRRLSQRIRTRIRERLRPANIARRLAYSAVAHALLGPAIAFAAEPAKDAAASSNASSWGLGLGMASAQKAYNGIDRDNMAIPLLYYENKWVRLMGPSLDVKLPSLSLGPSERLDFRLLARYDGSGYEADDAPILAGMAERKSSVWVGGKASLRSGPWELVGEAVADASGHSKGYRASFTVERSFRLGDGLMLNPRLGTNWLSNNYVNYYYGVRANEAMPGRSAYLGQAAFNVELGARATYVFNRTQSVFLDVGLTSLASEIKDSPLVGRSTENRVFLGYLYRF
jgi:outer membrane protein